jgi:nucleotide-binding universal stress UspA family protein
MESLKILIPTDFSVQAEFAYQLVSKMSENLSAEIHFLHVMNAPDTVAMDAAGNIDTCGDIDINYLLKQKDIAERQLQQLRNLYGSSISCHFVVGKLTDQIINFAEANHFDLIAMGTKGAWGLDEIFSGSETQLVARRSKVPVLSLMCDRSDLRIQNILLVHNFNQPAKENMPFMHKLIGAFNTKIHLLQIKACKTAAEKSELETNMKTFATLNNISNFACHVINDTDVERGVAHFDQLNQMDIVCIGTHGRGGLFHHSATEKLINHLFKPIISFQLH